MNKLQKKDFEILKGLGMSEQTASCLIRIAGSMGPDAYAEKPKAGYITSLAKPDFPINFKTSLEFLGFYALKPVTLGGAFGWCPGFKRAFQPYVDKFGLKDSDMLFILATFYTKWMNRDEYRIVYAPYGCKDYSSEDGWQFLGSYGYLMINTDPYYNLHPRKGKNTIVFQNDIEPLLELYRYAGTYKHFEHGSKLGAVAHLLLSEFAYQNLRALREDKALNEFVSVADEPFMMPKDRATELLKLPRDKRV